MYFPHLDNEVVQSDSPVNGRIASFVLYPRFPGRVNTPNHSQLNPFNPLQILYYPSEHSLGCIRTTVSKLNDRIQCLLLIFYIAAISRTRRRLIGFSNIRDFRGLHVYIPDAYNCNIINLTLRSGYRINFRSSHKYWE